MRILKDMGLTFFLALFLISSSFADDAKNAGTDKKDQPAADSSSTPGSKSDAASAPASPGHAQACRETGEACDAAATVPT